MTEPLKILVFGAHPDDPDFSAGGVAALYAQQGHRVKLVSLTNGDAGHHTNLLFEGINSLSFIDV